MFWERVLATNERLKAGMFGKLYRAKTIHFTTENRFTMHLSDLRKQNSTLDFRLYCCSEASSESGSMRALSALLSRQIFFGGSDIIGLGLGMHKTGLESRIWADTKIKLATHPEVVFSETGFIF